MRVQFAGIARPVLFENCPDLLDRFSAVSCGWSWQTAGEDAGEPCITVSAALLNGQRAWRITSRWTPQAAVYDDPADILCALVADLILARTEAERLLCLHAGAVAIGPGPDAPLFAFPADTMSGKSTLTAALALSGARLYSDDVLPVDLAGGPAAKAVALGIAPRPRLPLPDALPRPLRDEALRRMAIDNPRFGYIGLPRGQLAPLGERRPIAAFVLLERTPGHARLTAASRSEIMTLLLRQQFGAVPPAAELVERFAMLTATTRCWRLRHSDIGEAVALLTAQAQSLASSHRRLSA